MSSRKLVDKSISNLLWAYLTLFSTKILSLLAVVIVSAFLSPSEFGLMAFGLVILGYFELVQGFGMAAYLISTQDDTEEAAHAVFAFSVAMSTAIFLLVWTGADMVAAFFDQPDLALILRLLAISLLVEAFGQVHNSLLMRELKFRMKMVPTIARGLVKGFLGIGLAAAGFGVWSLVYAHIAGTLAWTVLLWVVRPWRPRAWPNLTVMRKAVLYGSNILGGALCNAVPRSLDQILIGKFLGPAPLGLYAMAYRMPQISIRGFGMQAHTVLHPVMSTIQNDRSAVQSYYYGTLRYFAITIFPFGVGVALATPSLIHLIYTEQWHGMIPVMQILSIGFTLGVVNGLPGNLYKALGRSDYFLISALINLPFVVVALFMSVQFGIEAVALAHVFLVFIIYLPNFLMLRHLIGITAGKTMIAATAGLICAGATAAAGLLAQQIVTEPGLVQLSLTIAVASAAYLLALWRVGPEVFSEIRRLSGKFLYKNRNRDDRR